MGRKPIDCSDARLMHWKCRRCGLAWAVPMAQYGEKPSNLPSAHSVTICEECLSKMGPRAAAKEKRIT